jgi:hypothetical protein
VLLCGSLYRRFIPPSSTHTSVITTIASGVMACGPWLRDWCRSGVPDWGLAAIAALICVLAVIGVHRRRSNARNADTPAEHSAVAFALSCCPPLVLVSLHLPDISWFPLLLQWLHLVPQLHSSTSLAPSSSPSVHGVVLLAFRGGLGLCDSRMYSSRQAAVGDIAPATATPPRCAALVYGRRTGPQAAKASHSVAPPFRCILPGCLQRRCYPLPEKSSKPHRLPPAIARSMALTSSGFMSVSPCSAASAATFVVAERLGRRPLLRLRLPPLASPCPACPTALRSLLRHPVCLLPALALALFFAFFAASFTRFNFVLAASVSGAPARRFLVRHESRSITAARRPRVSSSPSPTLGTPTITPTSIPDLRKGIRCAYQKSGEEGKFLHSQNIHGFFCHHVCR